MNTITGIFFIFNVLYISTMNNLFTFFSPVLSLLSLCLSAQTDLKFFLDKDKKFVDSTKALYYTIYKTGCDTGLKFGSVETYFMNSILLKKIEYKYDAAGKKQEREIYYYANGNMGSVVSTMNLPYQEQLSYFSNGKIKRRAYFSGNERVSEQFYTQNGQDTTWYDSDDRKPEFPGGLATLEKFIKEHVVYPKEAKFKGISGTVDIYVVIDRDGGIEKMAIQKGVNALLDAEAMRVVRSMPRWIPGVQKDQLLPKYQSIPVVFVPDKK